MFDASLLLQASYKGVSFHVKAAKPKVGRRLAEHEYPNSEDWFVEDLGIKIPKHSVTGYLATQCDPQDIYASADELLAICKTPEDGPLVLPPSTFVDAHCESCERDFDKDVQGYMAFSMEFVEASVGTGAPFMVGLAVRLISSAITQAVSFISDQGGQTIDSIGTTPDNLASAGAVVRTALAIIDDATVKAVVQPARAADLSASLTLVLSAVTVFEDSGVAPFVSPQSFTVVQPEILPAPGAPSSVSPAADAFAVMTAAIGTYVQLATDTTTQPAVLAVQLQQSIIDLGSDTLPHPGYGNAVYPGRVVATTYSTLRAAMVQACGSMVQILAAIAMCQSYADAVYVRRSDAQAARGLMVSTVEQVIYGFGSDVPGQDQLFQARDSASEAILSVIASLQPTIEMTLTEPMPALYLAWRIWQDPNRAQELADLNDAPHPFFMPRTFEVIGPGSA